MLKKAGDYVRKSQVWKSIFRHGPPTTARNRAMVMLANVVLHLHPVRARSSRTTRRNERTTLPHAAATCYCDPTPRPPPTLTVSWRRAGTSGARTLRW